LLGDRGDAHTQDTGEFAHAVFLPAQEQFEDPEPVEVAEGVEDIRVNV